MFQRIARRMNAYFAAVSGRRHSLVGVPELWKMKRDFQIQFLKSRGLRPNHRLIDIGCGTLRGGLPIINYLEKGNYVGVEIREEALVEARKELIEAGLESKEPRLVQVEDYPSLDLDCEVDFIWAFAVLIHMPNPVLLDVLDFSRRHLGDEGVFYGNVRTDEGTDRSWKEFPIVHRSFEFYREGCEKNGLGIEDIGSFKDLGHEPYEQKRMLKMWRA